MPNYKKKFNRYQMAQFRKQKYQQDMSGTGEYIFQNSNSHAELTLPRPTKTGLRRVAPGGKFEGDSYYLQLVEQGFLRLVKKLEDEPKKEESIVSEEKLILDQPDTYNQGGKVEHVVAQPATPVQKVNESGNQPQPAVLINESPVDDGFIIVEDD